MNIIHRLHSIYNTLAYIKLYNMFVVYIVLTTITDKANARVILPRSGEALVFRQCRFKYYSNDPTI